MKIIALRGLGSGKTFIGNLLEKHYRETGLPYKRIFISHKQEVKEINKLKHSDGYLIVETNLSELPLEAWQTITFQGGRS